MTKQEVRNNIKYNERLVDEFQRKVNTLNKKISDLNSQIKSYDTKINELRSKQKKLKDQIEELEQLKKKFQKLKEDFAARQAARRNKLKSMSNASWGVRFISSYFNGMSDFLDGAEYRRAYNGINSALEEIQKKINGFDSEEDIAGKQIASAQRSIDSKNKDKRNYQQQLTKAKSDLAYRKKRILYWKEQLKYAT